VSFRAEYSERSHDFVVALPLAEAFHLFTPEGEKLWAEGWNPTYLQPADGRTTRGMVFTTAHGGEDTIWMMARHEPQAGIVEYLRCTPESRTGRVLVQCTALDPLRTRVNVVYAMTGLTEAGNARVREMDAAHYRAYIESWSKSIEGALARRARG
jgi:hypothetical protein